VRAAGRRSCRATRTFSSRSSRFWIAWISTVPPAASDRGALTATVLRRTQCLGILEWLYSIKCLFCRAGVICDSKVTGRRALGSGDFQNNQKSDAAPSLEIADLRPIVRCEVPSAGALPRTRWGALVAPGALKEQRQGKHGERGKSPRRLFCRAMPLSSDCQPSQKCRGDLAYSGDHTHTLRHVHWTFS
jgi:hypothetical protein